VHAFSRVVPVTAFALVKKSPETASQRARFSSHFSGRVDLTSGRGSAEAQVELESVKPGDMRVNVLALQTAGEMLVVLS